MRCMTNSLTTTFFETTFDFKVVNNCVAKRITFDPLNSPYVFYPDTTTNKVLKVYSNNLTLCPVSLDIIYAGTFVGPSAITYIGSLGRALRINKVQGYEQDLKLKVTTTEGQTLESGLFSVKYVDCMTKLSFLSPLDPA